MTKLEKLAEVIMCDIDREESVKIWNAYAESVGQSDWHVYWMDEFDTVAAGLKPSELAEKITDNSFSTSDLVFIYDGCFFESRDYIGDFGFFDEDAMAQFVLNGYDTGNEEVQNIVNDETFDTFANTFAPAWENLCAALHDATIIAKSNGRDDLADKLTATMKQLIKIDY